MQIFANMDGVLENDFNKGRRIDVGLLKFD
jgi:hypothetical protein